MEKARAVKLCTLGGIVTTMEAARSPGPSLPGEDSRWSSLDAEKIIAKNRTIDGVVTRQQIHAFRGNELFESL